VYTVHMHRYVQVGGAPCIVGLYTDRVYVHSISFIIVRVWRVGCHRSSNKVSVLHRAATHDWAICMEQAS
jgi:hypothetical protein